MKQILIVTDRNGAALPPELLRSLQDKLSDEYEIITVDRESQQLQTYLEGFDHQILLLDEKQMERQSDEERFNSPLVKQIFAMSVDSLPIQNFPVERNGIKSLSKKQDNWPGQSYRTRRGKHR